MRVERGEHSEKRPETGDRITLTKASDNGKHPFDFKEIRKVGGIPFGRLAGIVLSKTDNVGRNHLIHRKRSPFPYEGKALSALQSERVFPYRAHIRAATLRSPQYGSVAPFRGAFLSLLLVGRAKPCLVRKGDRSAVDEV